MSQADRAARLVTVLAAVIWCNLALGCGSKETANEPLATHTPALITESSVEIGSSGRVVSGPSNIARFSPAESSLTTVNAADISIRQVFDDLGPDATLWYQHVQTLANPFFEGRAPATRGAELAADYIEFYFRQYGLDPAFADTGSYRQPFNYTTRSSFPTVTIDEASLIINGEVLVDGTDFVVLGNSGSGEILAPLSFVGYGIAEGPDDYSSFDEDTDLTGRIALLLRYAPLDDEGHQLWDAGDSRRQAALARKLRSVTERGAAAVLLVNPPGNAEGREGLEPLDRSRRFGAGLDVPVFQITPETADRIVRAADTEGRDLMAWRHLADRGEVTTVHFDEAAEADILAVVDRYRQSHDLSGQNVGGVLPGRGPLADEWIVIGAHHDHVGLGTHGGVNPSNRGQLHPGADDNASGTAGVLLLARKLSEAYADAPSDADLRSVLFVTFDAEEMGLHGSRYYADNPTIDPEKTSVMLNMDMIGRLRSHNLSVLGT
ncbi:MAG: M28 family peptidase, partial [Planctomycetota bacterium]